MAMAENLAAFFNSDEHAVDATYNGATTVAGIFDNVYQEVETGSAGVESALAVFTCAAADVPALAHGDTFLIDATTYVAVESQPDGTGVVAVVLRVQ